MRVAAAERLPLAQEDSDTLREGESVPDELTEIVGEAEEDRVTDTEAVEDRVKGTVVPIALLVRLTTRERVRPDGLTAVDGLGEGLKD